MIPFPFQAGGFGKSILSGDPYFDNVSLLLHCDGANASTTFTDSSRSPKTVTANGNAQISTTQSKFGGASGSFDGTGDYLNIGSTSDLEFGSGDGTIECFFRANAVPAVAAGLIERGNASGYSNFSLSYRASGKIEAYMSLAATATLPQIVASSSSLSLNTWYHIAFVKNGLVYTLYFDGVSVGTKTAASHPPTGLSTNTFIGAFTATTFFNNGYIDEMRVTKGVARYTSNFTPPTEPFPNS